MDWINQAQDKDSW